MIELLIVPTIMALLAGMAAANFGPLLQRMQVSAAVGDFHAAVLFARNAALRRGQRVDLLPAAPGNWQAGWWVVIDANNNHLADPGEPVLRRSPIPEGVDVTAMLRDRQYAYLAFDASGRPRSASSAAVPQFGTLIFHAGSERRKLIISFIGRVRVCDPDRSGASC